MKCKFMVSNRSYCTHNRRIIIAPLLCTLPTTVSQNPYAPLCFLLCSLHIKDANRVLTQELLIIIESRLKDHIS